MSVLYLEKDIFDSLTEMDIKRIIQENSINTKYKQLDDYYNGIHKILCETKKDSTAPNNKIVNNMCRYITDTIVGYFMGEPVSYSSDNEEYMRKLQDIYDYNDEQDENAELTKKCSIHGECYEMLYIDEDAQIRFTKIDAENFILIKSSNNDYLGGIRFIYSVLLDHTPITKAEFWTKSECWYFKSINKGTLDLIEIAEHYWNDLPFVEYINNEERRGDFEDIITLNDAYNRIQSNTANFYQYNDEALMLVSKLGEVSSQDIADMKEKGAVILDEGGDIRWLIKNIDDTPLENYKHRLQSDMHIYSSVPNMMDDNFGSNLSGISISYKLWRLEQEVAIKERKMKRGHQRRIELITHILNMFGNNYDYREISMKYKRNKPQNLQEVANIINSLSTYLSKQTLLGWIPDIDNVQDEINRKEDELRGENESTETYLNLAKAFDTQLMKGDVDG